MTLVGLYVFLQQIFASDEFLELTEYSREEILGRNCRYVIPPVMVTWNISLILHNSNCGE